MAVATLKYITEAEYLALEELAGTRHEYYNGQIFAMAGGTPEHAQLSSSVGRELGNALRGKTCRVFSSDLRVRVEATGLNTYPDVTVVCGDLMLTKERPQALTNPTVLVEVLSESTEAYDRGEKWRHYQTIESLTDYLLVWQDRPLVELYTRQSEATWTYRLFEGLEAEFPLERIGGRISLAELYRGLQFPPSPTLHAASLEPGDES